MILIFIFVCFIGGWIVLLTLAVMAGRRGRVLSKGRNLQAKFRGLGRIAGRTRGDIVRAVGPPNSFSSLAGGKILLQWISPGYHIALRFNGQGEESICEGVTHETAVR